MSIPMSLPLPAGGLLLNRKPYIAGDEIAFQDLIPGERYILKVDIQHQFLNMEPWYEEIELLTKNNQTGDYTYTILDEMHYPFNFRGDPLPPMLPPETPRPFMPPQPPQVLTGRYNPTQETFYKISAVKEGRHMVGFKIKDKLKKNIKRKHLNTILDRTGFSTNLGTGPADNIRKFVNLQPPKGTRRVFPPMRPGPHPYNIALRKAPLPHGPSEDNFAGGKRKRNKRKTRKHT